jgi:hypothetical protein
MPNARLEVLPGVGHMMLDEAAGSVARLVADFARQRTSDSFIVTRARGS